MPETMAKRFPVIEAVKKRIEDPFAIALIAKNAAPPRFSEFPNPDPRPDAEKIRQCSPAPESNRRGSAPMTLPRPEAILRDAAEHPMPVMYR